MGKSVTGISHEAQRLLTEYHWPGNVRELENVIERAVALEQTPVVLPETLPAHVRRTRARASAGRRARRPSVAAGAARTRGGFDLEARGEEFYRHYLALGPRTRRRRAGEGRRNARHELPVVPLLRQEVRRPSGADEEVR